MMPDHNNRLIQLDALRGFALLGILMVNVWAFADSYYATTGLNPEWLGWTDRLVRFLVALLFETKFYTLFAFLFGYSFNLLQRSAERQGQPFKPLMLRRLAGLLALGVLHGCLLFYGDILSFYALLGLVLLWWHGMAAHKTVKLALWLMLAVGVVWFLLGWLLLGHPDPTVNELAMRTLEAFQGGAAATRQYHTGQYLDNAVVMLLFQGPVVLALFLLGQLAGRLCLLEQGDFFFSRTGQRLLFWGIPAGVAGAVFYALTIRASADLGWLSFSLMASLLTSPFLTLGYVVALLLFFRSRAGQSLRDALAWAGRMSLSNYLLQSLLLGLVFTGYGLGLVDRLAPCWVVVLVLFIFVLQIRLSRWWLQRYRQGPVEWLLRRITSGFAS